MKKRTIAKTGATMLTMAMLLNGTTVLAAGSNYGPQIGGTKTTTIDKYLVMDQQANVPNVSFTYKVTAGKAKAYDADKKNVQILAGVDADKVTMAGVGTDAANTIKYAPGDATVQDVNALVKNYDKATEKYAKKTATLDFSKCNFTEPGIYRYIITESGTNQAVTNDEDATRVVDVYVNDDSSADGKKLTIAGYVLHSNESDIKAGDDLGSTNANPDGKSQGFTNEYDTSDLTFKKEVSGNQASHDKYFKFKVTIKNAVPGTVYNVNLLNADKTSKSNAATITENAGKTNPDKFTVGKDGTVTQEFYLQHGQEITIQGIAKDSTYSVTENKEDYKSTAAVVADYTAPANGTIESADLKTSYLNTRAGVIPTGVIMTVAPFAAVTLLGAAGMVKIRMSKKREDDEE
ncbi:MAG: QVPTGV class sortase B protein-sorting domain-containing protein [Ruminococcus sp.]|nr:QVPTGV class sortase B protein-sorting domain-containing protein [Ruminococcus sp.]